MWLVNFRGPQLHKKISIHTPHTRCDVGSLVNSYVQSDFNPHTSYEVWLVCSWIKVPDAIRFQSTHLIRGVTDCTLLYLDRVQMISIHTPHTRCDQNSASRVAEGLIISIHTPHTRCDLLQDASFMNTTEYFNPHTSYEVWPDFPFFQLRYFSYFNPHTSYEVWLGSLYSESFGNPFQSTHLIRGVTAVRYI